MWLCWSHWGCSWCQGLQTGQQPTVKFHSSKIAFHLHYDVLSLLSMQRRAIVDTLGWEPFQDWFYDQTFRGWWQVMFQQIKTVFERQTIKQMAENLWWSCHKSCKQRGCCAQVTGCVGVPLYRIYPRKTAWRTEKPEVQNEANSFIFTRRL